MGTTVGLSVRDNLGPFLHVRMLYDHGFKTISILALLQKKAFSSPKGFVSLYARMHGESISFFVSCYGFKIRCSLQDDTPMVRKTFAYSSPLLLLNATQRYFTL